MYFQRTYQPAFATKENKEFVDAYTKRMGVLPDDVGAWGYTGVMLLAMAVKNASLPLTRDGVREALSKIKDAPTILGDGRYSFDQNRFARYNGVVVQLVNGEQQIVPIN